MDPGSPTCMTGTLSSGWNSFKVTGISPTNLSNVKDFFKATFVFTSGSPTPGTGGTVYFDQIQYTPWDGSPRRACRPTPILYCNVSTQRRKI